MTVYYVLIDAKPSYEHRIFNRLKMEESIIEVDPLIVEETAEADPFFETFDLLAKINADDYEGLMKTVDTVIKSIEGVNRVKTLVRRI